MLSRTSPRMGGVNQEDGERERLFPSHLLLLGGDDVVMVTSAAQAMEVARTIAERFFHYTGGKSTISIGVVLAPVKYPFGLLQDLAEGAFKHAKMGGGKEEPYKEHNYIRLCETLIILMTVTGTSSHDFKKVDKSLHDRHVKVSGHEGRVGF